MAKTARNVNGNTVQAEQPKPEVRDVAVSHQSPAQRMAALARVAGEKVGEHVVAAIDAEIDHKLSKDYGTIATVFALEDDYSEEELAEWPRPGSEGGNKPDKITVPDTATKTGKRETTFYKELARATPEAVKLLQEVDWLERLGNDKAKVDDVPEEFRNQWSGAKMAIDRGSAIVDRNTRVQTIASALVRAQNFRFKLDDVNSLEGIEASVRCDKQGNPLKVVDIIWVRNPAEPLEGRRMNLTTFNRLDPAKAREMGGGWDNLEKTLKREIDDDDETKRISLEKIETVDTLVTVLIKAAAFGEDIQSSADNQHWVGLVKKLKADGADELVLAVGNLRGFLTSAMTEAKVNNRYTRLLTEDKGMPDDRKTVTDDGKQVEKTAA